MYTHKHPLHRKFNQANGGSQQQGLTMIELLVVIAILGIILAIGIPGFNRFISNWRLSNAVNAFNGSLRVARAESIARRKVVTMCATDGTNDCVAGANYSNGWMIYTESNNVKNPLVVQDAITGLSSITSGVALNIDFLPTGIMRSNQGTTFTFQSNAYVDDATTAWAKKQITISRTGRVRKT